MLLALVVPVILIAGAVYATSEVQRSTAVRAARQQVASQGLLTAMLDQETGARGYFLTREKNFLTPWFRGTTRFEADLARLRSMTAGDSSLERSLDDQMHHARRWHALTSAAIVRFAPIGRAAPTVHDALKRKGLMDDFRSAHAAFTASLDARGAQRLRWATVFAVGVAVALATLLALGWWLLTARLTRQDDARRRTQSELREMLQVSESEQDSRTLLIRHLERLVPGASAAVFNRNNSDDRLEMTRGAALGEGALAGVDVQQLRPRSCLAVRLSRPYDRRPGDDGLVRCEVCGEMPGASACEPLLVGGEVIGSALVISPAAIVPERRARVRDSVAQAAPILANQRNLILAQTRAASDALTGLPNRRSADETLKRMAAHAGRSVSPLAAVLLDLDHFKRLNDRHGHESGDKALAVVGRIISSTVRVSDFAARFGGEEFLLLLPDTDRSGAVAVAEKLRAEIARAELAGIGPISASLGVAVLPDDAPDGDALIRKADHALYAAKEQGRNRVHLFGVAAPEQAPAGSAL
jgi:diguanylate cyclase (GGDEF)-like protein